MSSISFYKYTNKQILCPIKSLLMASLLALILISSSLINPVLANSINQNSTKPNSNLIDKKQALDLHPDVWGYDLSDHKLIPEGYGSGLLYKAPDGDVVFEISRCAQNCGQAGKEKREYAMLWFFGGKVEFMKDSEATIAYSKKHQLEEYRADRIELSNGECIKTINVSTGKLCQVNDLAENIIIKGQCSVFDEPKNIYDHNIVTNQKPEIKRYSIIGAENNILRYIDKEDGYCDRGGPGGGEIIYQQLYPMQSLMQPIISLKDNTFVISRGNLIIRFDSNFKTKFISKRNIELAHDKIIKGNFFVLPYEKIEELMNKVAHDNDHAVQGLQNELLLYLYKRSENQ